MRLRRIVPKFPYEGEAAARRLVDDTDELGPELHRLALAIAAETGRRDVHEIGLQLKEAVTAETAWLLAR